MIFIYIFVIFFYIFKHYWVLLLQVQSLQGLLELKNSDILHLQSQLIGEAGRGATDTCHRTVAETQPMHVSITAVEARDNHQPPKEGATDFQKQIENLRAELKDTKESIGSQISKAGGRRNYPEIIKTYRIECNKLRKRVTESNKACDLLRSRLEELAEFLEQILDMDERGLIDLSKLSGISRAGLFKSLNDSRLLSQSLSQSILAGMETQMEEEFLLELSEAEGSEYPEDSY